MSGDRRDVTTCAVRVGTLTLREDDIVWFVGKPGLVTTLADAKEIVAAYPKLVGHRRVRIVVDLRGTRAVDREARQYLAGEETAAVASAMALVVDSGISRAVGNFFLRLAHPRFPTRLFDSVDEAVVWLKGLDI